MAIKSQVIFGLVMRLNGGKIVCGDKSVCDKVEEVKEVRRVGEVAREDMGSGDYRRHFTRLLRRGLLAMTFGGGLSE